MRGFLDMKEIIIKIENLNFYYPGEIKALENININICKNEIIGLIGQNGAGKTTLLKILLGLIKPTNGRVMIDGIDTREISISELAKKEGLVLQNPDRQLFANTVEEEIAFGPHNFGLSKKEIEERVEEAMAVVGIENFRDEYPPSLSKGDRAKVVIASVLAVKPQIIILDEPTTGQDYLGIRQIMDIVQRLHKCGHTIIIVTHYMPLVTEVTERTIVLSEGRILLDGKTREVFAQPDILKKTYIVSPQITQLAQKISKGLGVSPEALSVKELGDEVISKFKKFPKYI